MCVVASLHTKISVFQNNNNFLSLLSVISHVSEGRSKFAGAGAYREVHLVELPGTTTTTTATPLLVALKEFYYGANYDFRDFEFMRMDAYVSDLLTSRPSAVHSYGFCGTGMLVQGFGHGDLEDLALPVHKRRGEVAKIVLNDTADVDPLNSVSATQKLVYALEMAEALVELHGYPLGVIVHDDVHLGQFLVGDDGHLKLHDFNRAEIMLWNEQDQDYCRYRNNPGNGEVRRLVGI